MAWDRTWRCRKKSIQWDEFRSAAERIGGSYQGIQIELEREADDCWTCFFVVPNEDKTESSVYEVSLYNMGKDGFVLSLEADASDNRMSDESDQLAEDLAEALDAYPLEL